MARSSPTGQLPSGEVLDRQRIDARPRQVTGGAHTSQPTANHDYIGLFQLHSHILYSSLITINKDE